MTHATLLQHRSVYRCPERPLGEFLGRFPDLRVEIESYSSGYDQEPREDVDVFFQLRAPKDSLRRVRPFPGAARALFASPGYIQASGNPANPDDLTAHSCIGSGVWKLSRGKEVITPNLSFRVVSSDPVVNLKAALDGLGIATLPLWVARPEQVRKALVPIDRVAPMNPSKLLPLAHCKTGTDLVVTGILAIRLAATP
jgi:LysR family transcriptional activator of dmlA